MQKGAKFAHHTLALISENYLASLYTQPEWAAAFGSDPTGELRKLIPVRIQDIELDGLLPQIIYIDLVGKDEEEAKEVILKGVLNGRKKPIVAPLDKMEQKKQKTKETELKLKSALKLEKPNSLSEFTRVYNVSLKTARTCSSELCHEVVNRYSDYLAKKKQERKEKIIYEIESTIEELHDKGIYPKIDVVQRKLTTAYIFFKEEYREVWRRKVESLGIQFNT
jgi:hypothetical protein